jgi:hypothetical protein
MVRGINRADPLQRRRAGSAGKSFSEWRGTPCIVLSHQHDDTQACESIADYIVAIGIDVYFDKYDKDLGQLVAEGDANKITEHIQQGIDLSTHMVCAVSTRTITSYWVPFEVGYGYKSGINLGVVTLKGVEDRTLPEYMKTTRVIRGTRSLNYFIAELLGQPRDFLESRVSLKASALSHPLDNILDWNK